MELMLFLLRWVALAILTFGLFITYYFTFNSVHIHIKKKDKWEREIEWKGFQPKMLVLSILLSVFYGV